MRIEIIDLYKSFGDTRVLKDINLEIDDREFIGLLGPSGSGKTTLLRILAGLELPEEGQVLVNGEDLLAMPVQERQVGFVFQNYALFRHMSVFDNVAFGLQVRRRNRRMRRKEIAKRVAQLLELVQLGGMENRFPAQLSGGQRQRVALARTLAIEPKILLLDEPFGALDAKVRVELRRWLRDLHDSMGLITVFVTHDQDEALDLADRIAIMHAGRIEQIGEPEEIYDGPRTPFVYDFLGQSNHFDVEVSDGNAVIGDKRIEVKDKIPQGQGVAFVRPHDVVLALPGSDTDADDPMLPETGTVRFLSVIGPRASAEILVGKQLLEAELSRDKVKELDLKVGSECSVRLRQPRIFAKAKVEEIQTKAKAAKRKRLRFLRRRDRAHSL